MTISSVVPMILLHNNSMFKNCDEVMELKASLKQAVKDDMNSSCIHLGPKVQIQVR